MLGADVDQGPEQLTVYVSAPTRYQMPTCTIRFARQTTGGDMAYLTRAEIVVDGTGSPDTDPVALPAFGAEYQEEKVVDQEKHVPVTDCSADYQDDNVGCCRECNARRSSARFDLLFVVAAVALVLARPRRRRRR